MYMYTYIHVVHTVVSQYILKTISGLFSISLQEAFHSLPQMDRTPREVVHGLGETGS